MLIQHTPFIPNTEGVFMIPAEVYHNHQMAPEISRSLVVEMITSCPENVKAIIDGRVKKKITKAMQSGTLIDLALLEPDKFREGVSHWVVPEGLNLMTKEGRQWKTDHPGLPALKSVSDSPIEASAEDVRGMIESIMRHKLMRRVVEESQKQESFFCYHGSSGILRKCRLDMRTADNENRMTIVDLKSTGLGGTALGKFSHHAAHMNYHVQDAFYSDVCRDLTGEDPYFVFCVVERKPPYLVRMFQIHQSGKDAAREEYNKALDRYAKCKADGQWPAYPEKVEVVELPRWRIQPPEPVEE